MQILKILPSIKLPWSHVWSYKKFGPDRFSRFDDYWIKQTNTQTEKQSMHIEERERVIMFTAFDKAIPTQIHPLFNTMYMTGYLIALHFQGGIF